MSEAAYPERCGDSHDVQNGSSFEVTVPSGVVRLLGLDRYSRLEWRFSQNGTEYWGEAAVNPSGGSLKATIPARTARGMGIDGGARLNWFCEGGEPAEVRVLGSGLPPAEVYVADG
jgi:hypothetical protein